MKLFNKNSEIETILNKCNCIEYGTFKLKSGQISNFYIDVRKLYNEPKKMYRIAELIIKNIDKNNFNYIAGVPYGAVPIASYVALILNKPLLLIRKESKEYGKGLQIEGLIPGIENTVCLIEDVITTGSSIEFCMKLEEIQIKEICVIVDRRVEIKLNCKSLLKIEDLRLLNNKKSQLINKISNKKKTNLILSLDIKDMNLFLGFIKYIGPYICGIKTHLDILDEINSNIFYSNIEKIKAKYGIVWIEDRKFADIGSIMIKQYLTYKIEPDFITVHGISGKESIIELNNNINAGILLIYEMSSKGNLFNNEYKSLVLEIGQIINAAGFICQNRENISSNFLTFTPGINLESSGSSGNLGNLGKDNSQTYSDPRNKSSDFYIVGRGILNNNILYNSVLYRNICYYKKTNEIIFLNRKLISNIYNAAGVHCTSYNELLDLDYSGSGLVLSKTCTKEARIGNEFPRYYINDDLSINSTGLANDGIGVYTKYKFNKPYIISLAANNIEDFKYSLEQINAENVFAIEVNISCPNIEGFSENALNNFEKYLIILKNYACVPWGLKMPIFLSNIELEKYVNIIKNYNIAFIVCANSLPNGLVLHNQIPVIKPRNGLGGIGGFAGFKALALNNAREFKRLLPNIDIIGCGGIKTKEDILDYLSVGCSLVQIGTELDRQGLKLFNKLNSKLLENLSEIY